MKISAHGWIIFTKALSNAPKLVTVRTYVEDMLITDSKSW